MKYVLGAVAVCLAATAGVAQTLSDKRVAKETDWSVFVETDPTECWIVSGPEKWEARNRANRLIAVKRGEPRLFVSFRPGSNVEGEVSYFGGYPFADEQAVKITIGGRDFTMFASPEDETAWPPTPADDEKLIASMKRGANAVVSATSGRGNTTIDTFSLIGFTAAYEEAAKRCGG
jgi:hypothetical protein